MGLPKSEFFQIHYDWDTGLWKLGVYGASGRIMAWKTYPTSEAADDGLVALRKDLCTAPHGNPIRVLAEWGDWVEPKLLPPS